jgi:hypothetical protein
MLNFEWNKDKIINVWKLKKIKYVRHQQNKCNVNTRYIDFWLHLLLVSSRRVRPHALCHSYLPCLKWLCNYVRYYRFFVPLCTSPCDLLRGNCPHVLLTLSARAQFQCLRIYELFMTKTSCCNQYVLDGMEW